MKIPFHNFRVPEQTTVKLDQWLTWRKPLYINNTHYKKKLKEHIAELSSLQHLLYAHNRYALLIIFQAMDAAGKDSAIRHIMSGVNPQGCQVFSFAHPSATELVMIFSGARRNLSLNVAESAFLIGRIMRKC